MIKMELPWKGWESDGVAEIQAFLDQGGDVNLRSPHWETLLTRASDFNKEKAARLLLEKGADPNFCAPLCSAARAGHVEIIRLLLGAGADPNLLEHDYTPLMTAARSCHPEVLGVLLEAGADPNLMGDGSALFWASAKWSESMIQMLFDAGANPFLHTLERERHYHPLVSEKQDHYIGRAQDLYAMTNDLAFPPELTLRVFATACMLREM